MHSNAQIIKIDIEIRQTKLNGEHTQMDNYNVSINNNEHHYTMKTFLCPLLNLLNWFYKEKKTAYSKGVKKEL